MRTFFRSKWIVKLVSITIILIYSCMTSGFTAFHQQPHSEEWTLVSQFGGNTQSVAVSGNFVYAGIGLRMNIIDASDTSKPKLIGMSDTFSDMIQDIYIDNGIAYLAAGKAGLILIDVSTPANPVTLGTWNSYGFAEGVAVDGEIAVVANGPKGISIINVADPSSPEEMASLYLNKYTFDVAVSDHTAFIAAGEAGLLTLDISDPAHPQPLAQFDTDGYAYDISLSGKYAYVADAWEGIEIFNIEHPSTPFWSGKFATNGWSLGVAVSENHLISSNGAQGIDLFELTSPSKPVLRGTYYKESIEGDASARKVVISGNTAYIADTINGLRMVDISDLEQPRQQGIFSVMSYARRLSIRDDYAYVATASEGSMVAVNINDPIRPYQVSKFQADGIAVDVVLNGNYATLGTFEDASYCYSVIDVSNPTDTPQTSGLSIFSLICGAPRQMVARDNYVYSADEWGLSIYDLSDPHNFATAGRIELEQEGNQTVALSVSGDYAYVADADSGVKIVDISDPTDPKFIRAYTPSNVVGSVFSSEDILYIGQYGEGIITAKISQSGEMPTRLGEYKTRSSVEETIVSDGILVASEGSGGLEILDVSDPKNIDLLKSIQTPGFAWASVIEGEYIYVADGAAGVLIFHKGPVEQSNENNTQVAYPQITIHSIEKQNGSDAPIYPDPGHKVISSEFCTVESTDDSGNGTLRDCLMSVRSGATILFDPAVFPPNQPATIFLENELPEMLIGSITIDASNAGVILDGQQKVESGLKVSSSYNTIMGIQFINFTTDGLNVGFPGQFNQIGGDHTIGEGPSGQGNVFSNNFNGIRLCYTQYNTVKGNFVGTNANGTQAAELNWLGIVLSNYTSYNMIGGALEGEKNIISNNDRGIDIAANSASYNTVAGNYIGTDVTGTKAIPNTSWGVLIEVGGRNNIIGGTTPAERNIISGNVSGVTISDYASTQNTIIGNYIGLDVTGKVALPNQNGAGIFQSKYNRIGGTAPGESNLISANTYSGVSIFGIGENQAIVLGNTIGLDSTGTKSLPNSIGIRITGGTHNLVGGTGNSSANTLSGNQLGLQIEYEGTDNNWIVGNTITGSMQAAIRIDNYASGNFVLNNTISNSDIGITISQAVNNLLRGNSISGNSFTGIELLEGGNLELAAPELDQATANSVTGKTCPFCIVEIFSDPDDQGLVFEGSTIANEAGDFSYAGELQGPNITATASDLNGNTSAFSKAIPIK